MSKVKKFGISSALSQGLSETIQMVENDSGMLRETILPVNRIEVDPQNPRKLTIELSDLPQGPSKADSKFDKKNEEFLKLTELGESIKKSGLLNPIIVYKHSDKYRIVAGERRFLACMIIGKSFIEARVFNDKPSGFQLKLVQWFENTAREDLSLQERVNNIKEVANAYQTENPAITVNPQLLQEITGLSSQQAWTYFSVINADQELVLDVYAAGIQSLDKAALLLNIPEKRERERAINACKDGLSLKELRLLLKKKTSKKQISTKGRKPTRVNLGTVSNQNIVKTIIDSVLSSSKFKKYSYEFKSINWTSMSDVNQGFKKLISILESELA